MADSWEGCNYSITGTQGSRCEHTGKQLPKERSPGGAPLWPIPGVGPCSWSSPGPHLQACYMQAANNNNSNGNGDNYGYFSLC